MFLLFSAKMNGSGSNAKLMVYGAVYFVYLFLENEHERLKLSQQFKLQPQPQTFQISHSFTHFTWLLNAHVFHVEPDQKEHLAIELEGQWLSPEQAIAKGVPTAMKKLISTSRS